MMKARDLERGARSDGLVPLIAVPRSALRAPRFAFTLLEIMLTLSIAGVIIAAVGAAIQTHFRVVDAGRAEVEQAQLARVLLRRMADDLRAALPIAENDDSTSSTAADAASSAASAASGSSGSSGGSNSASNGDSTSSASAAAATAASAASSATSSDAEDDAPVQPNFLGSQYQVQLDVSRLPDAHQFAAATSDAALSGALPVADSLSDVQTVSYYLGAVTNGAADADPFALPTETVAADVGLVRRQLSRAASVFGATQGGSDATSYERLLAVEAVALEFHYYDGTQWLADWDSSSTGGLPTCVEILLTLRSAAPGVASDPLSLFAAGGDVLEKTYRLVVALPAASTTSSTSDSSSSDTEAAP